MVAAPEPPTSPPAEDCELANTSEKYICPALKPTVLALAMLLLMTSRFLLAAFSAFIPLVKPICESP